LKGAGEVRIGDADEQGAGVAVRLEDLPESARNASRSLNFPSSSSPDFLKITSIPLDGSNLSPEQQGYLSRLPSSAVLRRKLELYVKNNSMLATRSKALKKKDGELEAMYRKVVSLCTNVDESRVDELVGGLVAAVESERDDSVDVGRVKDFLRKVEGVEG
jgi:hypothetical protein